MKKKIVSALMAVAMCVSALPVSVYAESDATAEYPEFTQKFIDAYLLEPEESEINHYAYQLSKRLFGWAVSNAIQYNRNPYDEFLGINKESDRYCFYQTQIVNPEDEPEFYNKGINIVQYIDEIFYLYPDYSDNPYITEKEYEELSYEELIIMYEKIYEETGLSIFNWYNAEMFFRLYVDENGKGYNMFGEEIDIVDGKIVEVYNNMPDNADILTTETLTGDANEDGSVSLADAVLIMQVLSNPDDFALTEQGSKNADYNGDGGVTTADALEIQILCIS